MMQSSDETAIKAAKKSLKKAEGPMKLKELAKTVTAKVKDDAVTVKVVKQLLRNHEKFQVDGKVISLKRRRSLSPKDPSEELVKSAKKSKKNKRDSTTTTTAPAAGAVQSQDAVVEWRKDNKIVVLHATDDKEGKKKSTELQNEPSLFPYTTFDDCCRRASKAVLNEALIQRCTGPANGFTKPSPIQAQSWPIMTVKGGRDMVGIAETGSGKTLAFALPALSAMAAADNATTNTSKRARSLPRMLVLAPTRELAMQSAQVLKEFGAFVGLTSLTVYGGVPKHQQKATLAKGVDCLVATPGRLKDLIQDERVGSCDLSAVRHLVLDEADRMLDMGFEEDVRFIISNCSCPQRQTVMFSATWPAAIQQIAMEYMVDPVRVYVGFESIAGEDGDAAVDDSLSANKRVRQTVEVIEDRQREARLRQVLEKVHGKNRNHRVLVFALYKKEAERLEYSLRRDGWNCCSIHGNKNQQARTEALAQFKDGSCPLLVATDVAARGLDIPNVEAVINYTFPLTIEDYVHRIGRTGRAGKSGESYTFFQPTDKSHAGELQQVLRQVGQTIPEALASFGNTIKKKEHKLYGNFGPKDSTTMKKATKITFDYDSDE